MLYYLTVCSRTITRNNDAISRQGLDILSMNDKPILMFTLLTLKKTILKIILKWFFTFRIIN